jgi:hypothetical protein
MGIDLEIFPVWEEELLRLLGVIKTPSCLRFERDSRLFDQLLGELKGSSTDLATTEPSIQTHPLPTGVVVETYSESGLFKTRHSKSGGELRFAYARDLKKLVYASKTDARNLAIKAYIDALPDDLMVVLYWC